MVSGLIQNTRLSPLATHTHKYLIKRCQNASRKSSGYTKEVVKLTDVLGVNHGSLSVVLVDHVLLGKLQMQVSTPLLISAENCPIDLHAGPEVCCLSVLLLCVPSLICFQLFLRGLRSPISIKHLHLDTICSFTSILFINRAEEPLSLQLNQTNLPLFI